MYGGSTEGTSTESSGTKPSEPSKPLDIVKTVSDARTTAQALKGETESILICVVLFLITIVIYTVGDDPSIFRYALCVSFMSMTFAASGSFLLFKGMKEGTIAAQEYVLMGLMALSFIAWCFFVIELYSKECDDDTD